tara:strand:- start:312 stop:848 length:537 start_codon:yes stop_codon:yes gene_type:complete
MCSASDAEEAVEEVVEVVDDAYQGSDVDNFLEDTQETGEFVVDVVNTVITGEPQGDVAEIQNELQDTADAYSDIADDASDAMQDLGDAVAETYDTSMEVASNIGTNVARALGLNPEGKGSEVTEADRTQGGDVLRDEDLLQLDTKKSALKAKKKRGKKGLRIDYATSIPGTGKSGLAA